MELRWETKKHTYPKDAPQKDTTVSYMYGDCPECGSTNTLIAWRDGECRMKQAPQCTICFAALPGSKEIEEAAQCGPPKEEKGTSKKKPTVQKETPPEPTKKPEVEITELDV